MSSRWWARSTLWRPIWWRCAGDLTQRARSAQFREARAFIDRLEPPVLSVPGNHDVPLYNLWLRVFWPWRRYRRWIDRDLEPVFRDDEIIVAGVNTVNPWSWQRGWFSRRDIATVRAAFEGTRGRRVRLVVVHHPMEHMPGEKKSLMHGADRAIRELSDLGTDIVLSGHLHTWRAEPFTRLDGGRSAVQVHAGTGLSTRMRGEENDFNLLTLEDHRLRVDRYAADQELSFDLDSTAVFERTESGWRPVGDGSRMAGACR